MLTFKRVKSWVQLPSIGMQCWKPNFAQQSDETIKKFIKDDWLPFGYNYAIMCEDTNTLHLYSSI